MNGNNKCGVVLLDCCQYVVSRFNCLGELFGYKASLGEDFNVNIKNANGDLLMSYSLKDSIPKPKYAMEFKDTDGGEVKFNIDGIEKTIDGKTFIFTQPSSGNMTLKYIDPTSQYGVMEITYSEPGWGLHIQFGNDTTQKELEFVLKDEIFKAVSRTDSKSKKSGFSISMRGARVFKGDEDEEYIRNLNYEEMKGLVKSTVANPTINDLILNSIIEMNSVFPGVLNLLNQKDSVIRILTGLYDRKPFVDLLADLTLGNIREVRKKYVERKSECEIFASRVNRFSKLLGFKANVFEKPGFVVGINIRDSKGEELASRVVTEEVPGEKSEIFFEDEDNSRIRIFKVPAAIHIEKMKVCGSKDHKVDSYKLTTFVHNSCTDETMFSYVDFGSEDYVKKTVEIGNSVIITTERGEDSNNRDYKLKVAFTDNIVRVTAKQDADSSEVELGFGYDTKVCKDGEQIYTCGLGNYGARTIAKNALLHPTINRLIWDALKDVDSSIPWLLDSLTTNTGIERELSGDYESYPLIEEVVARSGITSFEASKGISIQPRRVEKD